MYLPISNLTFLVGSAFVCNCILSDRNSFRHRKDSFECFEPRILDGEKEMQIVSAEISKDYFVKISNEMEIIGASCGNIQAHSNVANQVSQGPQATRMDVEANRCPRSISLIGVPSGYAKE